MRFTARALTLFVCGLVASMALASGVSRADDVGPLGEFALTLALKGEDGSVRPISGVEFDLTCTGADAFSSRLCTDTGGQATTYARPGKCLLKSRSPLRLGGKKLTWSGNVEFYATKETRLDLSEENAVVQDDDQGDPAPTPSCGGERQLPNGDVRLPVVVRKVEPEFPREALKPPRLEGHVICQAVIGTDGHVREVTVLKTTNPIFNASAIRAVSRRRYIPAQSHGVPCAIYFTIRLDYR